MTDTWEPCHSNDLIHDYKRQARTLPTKVGGTVAFLLCYTLYYYINVPPRSVLLLQHCCCYSTVGIELGSRTVMPEYTVLRSLYG